MTQSARANDALSLQQMRHPIANCNTFCGPYPKTIFLEPYRTGEQADRQLSPTVAPSVAQLPSGARRREQDILPPLAHSNYLALVASALNHISQQGSAIELQQLKHFIFSVNV